MEINNIQTFLEYYESARKRTLAVVRAIPTDKFDWTYREGKFTLADMVRHIAAINLLGVTAPPMYGLTSEQVREGSQP